MDDGRITTVLRLTANAVRRLFLAFFLLSLSLCLPRISPAAGRLVASGDWVHRALGACPGDCGGDLSSKPKAVEKYMKKSWKKLAKCARKGSPACPDTCPVPFAADFGVSAECGTKLDCNLDAMASGAFGSSWDEAIRCANSPADSCGLSASKAVGKTLIKKLKRRRTSKMHRYAKDETKCVALADKPGACSGATICPVVGEWLDEVLPVVVARNGTQWVVLDADVQGEGVALLRLSAEGVDWIDLENTSVVVEYEVDGTSLRTIVLYGGARPTDYRIQLGELSLGRHRLGLRHRKDLNALSGVPVLMYVNSSPGAGVTHYDYTLIWSNEDGRTGKFPEVLISRWGRPHDIETIVRVDVSDAGVLDGVWYRFDESGSLLGFAGGRSRELTPSFVRGRPTA